MDSKTFELLVVLSMCKPIRSFSCYTCYLRFPPESTAAGHHGLGLVESHNHHHGKSITKFSSLVKDSILSTKRLETAPVAWCQSTQGTLCWLPMSSSLCLLPSISEAQIQPYVGRKHMSKLLTPRCPYFARQLVQDMPSSHFLDPLNQI
jgi:hypothetical protein